MPEPTDEVRPDIKATKNPIETHVDAGFSDLSFVLFAIFLCVELVVILIY